jgi:hypothetical protein
MPQEPEWKVRLGECARAWLGGWVGAPLRAHVNEHATNAVLLISHVGCQRLLIDHPACAHTPPNLTRRACMPTPLSTKVLVYDKYGENILSPLLSVSELRELGVTLYLQLHSDREHIPGEHWPTVTRSLANTHATGRAQESTRTRAHVQSHTHTHTHTHTRSHTHAHTHTHTHTHLS